MKWKNPKEELPTNDDELMVLAGDAIIKCQYDPWDKKHFYTWTDIPYHGNERVELMVDVELWIYESELVEFILSEQ